MINKITNTILLLIVFLTTTGFSISLHYCCDSLVSMSINSDVTPCCPVENGCCDNETQHIQLEENLTTPLSDNIQKFETEEILTVVDLLISEDLNEINYINSILSDSSPPGDLQENLAKLQSFLL
jgi:hypothetical protein